MINAPRLSALDVVPVGPGVSAKQAFEWTTEVARTIEALGFHRLWVAEHHGVSDIGSSVPAVLIAHLAASTTTLRLGSGGVMIHNHAPLAIAEQFSILNALHPGRIDLGIGRGRGANALTLRALGLTESEPTQAFVEKLDALIGFLNGTLPATNPYATVNVSPSPSPIPMYFLGSSIDGARMAAARGLPFAFAHHLSPGVTTSAMSDYRALFQPSAITPEPYTMITASVVCAESQTIAERAAVAASAVRARLMVARREGRTISSRELLSPQLSDDESALLAEILSSPSMLIGTPKTVSDGLFELLVTTGTDEIMLIPMEYEGPDRIRSLTLAKLGFHP